MKRNLFFLVINIEYGVVLGHDARVPDTYVGASAGELGCWVDSESTRILQASNEQSDVPGYWDIGVFRETPKSIS